MTNKQTKDQGKKVNLDNRYNPRDASMRKLNFGLWWLKNRGKFRTGVITILAIVSLISWGYTIFHWSYYFLVLEERDDEMVRAMAERRTVPYVYLRSRAAQSLSVSSVYMLRSGEKYDLYTVIKNPNAKHWGLISYCFIMGSQELDCKKDFILPEQTKYILSLAHELGAKRKNVKFMVKNTSWVKLNPHDISDWDSFEDEHLDLKIGEVEFTPASQNELTEKINLNLLEFTVENQTPYSYYEMPINIILFRSSKVVGVNRYVIKDFGSNKKEPIKITWPGYIGGITEAKIDPDINILKDDIYSP